MNMAVWRGLAVCVIGTWAMSTSEVSAQEPTPEAPPAQQQQQQDLLIQTPTNAWSAVVGPTGNVHLSLTTFGNPLGVEAAAVDPALRAQLNIEEGKGVVITAVREDSEAAKAGLKQHDIVLSIDQQSIESPEKLHEVVASRQGQVQVQLLRQGKPETLAITLANTPVYQFANVYAGDLLANIGSVSSQYRIGAQLAEADDTLRSQLRLAAGEGLVVTEVLPDSPVAKAGVRQHDVLIKLDGKRLSTVDNLTALVQEIKDRQVTLAFVRGGAEMSCDVTPQLSSEPAANLFLRRTMSNYNQLLQPLNALNRLGTMSNYNQLVDAENRLNLQCWIAQPGVGAVFNPSPPTTAADQIAGLKKQLAEMQQSLQALEASLGQQPAHQQPSTEQPPAAEQSPTPEQPSPEQPPQEHPQSSPQN